MPVVVGIETSCDETGIGVVRDGELIGEALASSMDEHARFGGVVPEVAARAHLEALVPAMELALTSAGITSDDVDAIAVTAGPGLATALQVGLAAAKAYSIAWGVPLYGVHHLAGHVAADALAHGALPNPCVVLIVSGGHTSLLYCRDLVDDPIEHLGDTLDDAAGEAFDKVGRVLGLPFPGGPAIDRIAREGNPTAIAFPRGLSRPQDPRFEFSFSGLKTAVARWVEAHEGDLPVADVCASFQEAVVEVQVDKTIAAAKEKGVRSIVLGGGVVANSRLRLLMAQRAAAEGVALLIPPPELCTDNAAMIACAGFHHLNLGERTGLDVGASPSLSIGGPEVA